MSVKNMVLSALEQHKGNPISGEQLAAKLNISRTAVWKSVNQLKASGYVIVTLPGKGYVLDENTDMLSKEGILPYLPTELNGIEINVYESVDSTNNVAKRLALDGAPHGSTVLTNEQTAGKGRLGRSFHSPPNTAAYVSIILRLPLQSCDAILITTAAAIAVCRAIKVVAPQLEPQIKWVNDVYINGRKICGILTEAVTDFESGSIESIVVGMGINITTEFPAELSEVATSLLQEGVQVKRNHLIGVLITELMALTKGIENRSFMEEYRELSMTIGMEVTVISPIERYQAMVLDVDRNGGLVVRRIDDGALTTLNSGEISIRPSERIN